MTGQGTAKSGGGNGETGEKRNPMKMLLLDGCGKENNEHGLENSGWKIFHLKKKKIYFSKQSNII